MGFGFSFRFWLPGLALLTACSPSPNKQIQRENIQQSAPAKNVILLIGDGMGLAQISAALYSQDGPLALERFPITGAHKPYASNDLITDSAAGATAFSAGVKTYNGAVGVDTDSMPVTTILEEAEERGLATGLVATSSITHATPAAFIAHVKSRKQMEDIALFFLETEIDLFVGGGLRYFSDRSQDERNLVDELREKGWQVYTHLDHELEELEPGTSSNFAYFSANDQPLPRSQGRIHLPHATQMASAFLKAHSEEGFFLMVEGAQIDWGGHAHASDYIVSEMLDFDRAVAEALDFAQAEGQPLVLVTADTAPGGYALNPGSTPDSLITGLTTTDPQAHPVTVFAKRPRAELFSGIYENTEIYHRMRKALAWQE